MGTALVTGATGFIGSAVVRALLERGRRVRALVREGSDRSQLDERAVEIVRGDLRDAASVRRAVAGCSQVYHVAADYRFWARDPREIWRTNVEGTLNVMQACVAEEVERVVHTSTVGTIGLGDLPAPCHEDSPPAPGQFHGHYKRSKLEAERIALRFAADGLPVVVVNPSAPVGPGDARPTPTGRIIVDFAHGRLPAYVDTGLNVVHVQDVATGHLLAAERGRVGERYILGNENLTLAAILRELADLLGRAAPRWRIPYAAAWVAGAVSTAVADRVTHRPPGIALESVRMARRRMFFDPSKAVRELGVPRTPVRQAFEDALRWYQQRGLVSPNGPRSLRPTP